MPDSDIGPGLLAHLRGQTGLPLECAEPPRRITGDFDTHIFGFRLSGAPAGLAGPLILRLFRTDDDPRRALFDTRLPAA